MTRRTGGLWSVIVCVACLGWLAGLTLRAFYWNIAVFRAPSQLKAPPPAADRTVRLGGMVFAGSLHRETHNGEPVNAFQITDGQAAIEVHFTGILPDLFREGQSVVALGSLQRDGDFTASEVRAKHDETYMPKEVADELKRTGKWDPRFGKAPDASSWDTMTAKKPASDTQSLKTGG